MFHRTFVLVLISIVAILIYITNRSVGDNLGGVMMPDPTAVESQSQDALKSRIHELSSSVERWKNLKIIIVTLSGILALVAVAFEVMQDIDVSKRSTAEQQLSALIKRESDLAIAEAGNRALEAEARSAEAGKQAAEANLLARQYESDIAESNARAAEAQLEAEKLRQRFADRTIDSEGFEELVQTAANFGKQQYRIVTYWDSREPLALANRIHAALRQAGWERLSLGNGAGLFPGTEGVDIFVHPKADEKTRQAAIALARCLRGLGVKVDSKQMKSELARPEIGINVGAKP